MAGRDHKEPTCCALHPHVNPGTKSSHTHLCPSLPFISPPRETKAEFRMWICVVVNEFALSEMSRWRGAGSYLYVCATAAKTWETVTRIASSASFNPQEQSDSAISQSPLWGEDAAKNPASCFESGNERLCRCEIALGYGWMTYHCYSSLAIIREKNVWAELCWTVDYVGVLEAFQPNLLRHCVH